MVRCALGKSPSVLSCVVVSGSEQATVGGKNNTDLGEKIVSMKIFRLKYLSFCYKKN